MIAVLDYGIGNLRSAEKAIHAAGGDTQLVSSPNRAKDATAVVLPGVGAFGACMKALCDSGLDAVVRDAVESKIPFLGICVGMQMLFEGSDESPGVPGLGVFEGHVTRLPSGVKAPQMQWNRVEAVRDSTLLSGGEAPWCYFVHSYSAVPQDPSVIAATCDYGGAVTAIVERENVMATQFHPEKSSIAGRLILEKFVAVAS